MSQGLAQSPALPWDRWLTSLGLFSPDARGNSQTSCADKAQGLCVCVLTYGDKASRQKEHRSPLTEQLEQSLGAGYGGVGHVTRPLTPGETQAQQALVLCPGHRLPSNKVAHSV